MPTVAQWPAEPPTKPIENVPSMALVRRERLRERLHERLDRLLDCLEQEDVAELLTLSSGGR
jgi:hypothetical protein